MKNDRFVRAALTFIVFFLAGVVLKTAKSILIPFSLAVFVSFLVAAPFDALIKRKVPRILAYLAVLFLAFFVLYLAASLFYDSGQSFVAEFPRYAQKFEALWKELDAWLAARNVGGLNALLAKIDVGKITSSAVQVLGPFFSVLSNVFMVLIFLAFLLASRGKLAAKLRIILPGDEAAEAGSVLKAMHREIAGYVKIKTLMSALNGLLVWVVLLAFGADFAAPQGILAFFLNYIPTVGSGMAALVRFALAFAQFGNIWTPLLILVVTAGLDSLMGNILEPRLMGRGLDLSPLLVLFAVFFWTWMWGIPGTILAVPIAVMGKIACDHVPGLRPIGVLMGGGGKDLNRR
jgi:AI-2 transport protein TqsA